MSKNTSKTSNSKHILALDIALNTLGYERVKKIGKSSLDFKDLWEMPAGEVKAKLGKEEFVESFLDTRNSINPDEEAKKLEKQKINFVTIFDKEYPKLLKEIFSPPVVLYYKGDIGILNELTLAVVGSRKFTTYGRNATEKIVSGLTETGCVIASGMALGIDTFAHETALYKQGKTVAVLGRGLDAPYPVTNANLFRRIIESGGLVLSEYMPGKPPLPQHFPARNRIISGISKGVLIVEGGIKSGALITARNALEQNRDVFAIPGTIFGDSSSGTNQLLKMGATPVTSPEDILEHYDIGKRVQKRQWTPSNETEKAIFDILTERKSHIDSIIRQSKLDRQIVTSTLTLMEIKGKVKNLGGMIYTLD